jgi:phosphopantetheine adenylyltransferase
MAIVNRRLCSKETVFLMASSGRIHISSTFIRELAMYERKLDNFVPPIVEEEVYAYLFDYYKKNNK